MSRLEEKYSKIDWPSIMLDREAITLLATNKVKVAAQKHFYWPSFLKCGPHAKI